MESWTFKTQIFTESVNHSTTDSKLDALERLRQLNGERIFIVCDPFLVGTPALQTVIDIISTDNTYIVYSDVVPDPPIDSIIKGVSVLKKRNLQYLL